MHEFDLLLPDLLRAWREERLAKARRERLIRLAHDDAGDHAELPVPREAADHGELAGLSGSGPIEARVLLASQVDVLEAERPAPVVGRKVVLEPADVA